MKNRIEASLLCTVGVLALAGCGVFDLDVGNPNNLIEESIRQEAASSAVVNGSLSLVSTAISTIWQPYLVASDELYWIGSRDAWGQLDNGFLDSKDNEFIDGSFPEVGQADWMAREAVRILTEHVTAKPANTDFQFDLAKAQLYYGMMLMVTGEVMEDMAFSDKTEDGQPYSMQGKSMADVITEGITQLDAAVTAFNTQGETAYLMRARALRARAAQSLAISQAINPTGATPILVNAGGGDAAAVITMAGGNTVDWNYDLTFTASSQSNDLASWMNERKENQFDLSLVTVDAANNLTGVKLQDPIDNVADPVVQMRIGHFKGGGNYLDDSNQYVPLTIASTRLMHLILAENALQGGDAATFTTEINYIRAMDGLTAFSGQISNQAMLEHTRRVNTLIMGLRLADMYRWGLQPSTADGTLAAAVWNAASVAVTAPGHMLVMGDIEYRSNCYLNGSC